MRLQQSPTIKPAPRKPPQRLTFAATYDGETLRVTRGAWIVETDESGSETRRHRDTSSVPRIELGDRCVVFSDADLAILEVTRVVKSDWTHSVFAVSMTCGSLAPGSCFVMPAGGLR